MAFTLRRQITKARLRGSLLRGTVCGLISLYIHLFLSSIQSAWDLLDVFVAPTLTFSVFFACFFWMIERYGVHDRLHVVYQGDGTTPQSSPDDSKPLDSGRGAETPPATERPAPARQTAPSTASAEAAKDPVTP